MSLQAADPQAVLEEMPPSLCSGSLASPAPAAPAWRRKRQYAFGAYGEKCSQRPLRGFCTVGPCQPRQRPWALPAEDMPAGPALNSYGEFSRLAQRRRIDLEQARSSTESEVGHARSDSHSSVRTDFVLKPVRRAAHDAERDVPIAGDVAPGQVVRAPGTYGIWLVNFVAAPEAHVGR